MRYGLDDETREEIKTEVEVIKPKRMPFAYWNVGGRDYRLKLTTEVICQLEEKFKCNLINMLSSTGGLPPLAVMLTIIQGALKPWEHGIKYKDVQLLFDTYCEEGGTQLTLMTDVLLPVFSVSGFFSASQAESMNQKIEEARELL